MKGKAMHNVVLGTLIDETQQRDAIHVAVAPVVASEKLYPGQHIGLTGDNRVGVVEKPIGIVDPFLLGPVFPGQRFWMVLYQQTITSLRHDWTHPAFGAAASVSPVKSASEAWMQNYADELQLSYDELLEVGREYLRSGDMHCFGRDTPDECYSNRKDFWKHWEVLTGDKVPEDDKEAVPFRCAC